MSHASIICQLLQLLYRVDERELLLEQDPGGGSGQVRLYSYGKVRIWVVETHVQDPDLGQR
jgi:hypothetical protein